jgi:hypothetical protein
MHALIRTSTDRELVSRAWFTMVDAQFMMGDLDEAMRTHANAVAHFPDFCEVVGHTSCRAVCAYADAKGDSYETGENLKTTE